MQRKRKSTALEQPVPNFTGHDYSDVIGDFSEHDRLSENDISQLTCLDEYQLEWTLNSFNDSELNDHLHHLFYCKKTENISLMRRWISYYVRQYPKQITAKAQPYLNSKKLTLEDWLRCVRDGRRGDIMCVFLLSLSTGVHMVVHLKNNKLWSTLKTIPATHSELLSICDQHLAYLGFGVFLKLERKPTQRKILGTITGVDNETQQLLLQSINAAAAAETTTRPLDSAIGTTITAYTSILTGTTASTRLENTTPLTGTTLPDALSCTVTSLVQGKPASAAAGSKEQLPRLQVELSGITPPSTRCTQSTSFRTTITSSRNKRQPKDSVIPEGESQLPPKKTDLTSTVPQDSTEATATRICKRQSKVHLIPFQVQLTRLSDKELEKYMYSYDSKSVSTLSHSSRLSPVATRSLTRLKQPQCKKKAY